MKLEIRDKDHAAILDKHYHEQTVIEFAGVSLAIVGASCNYQPYRTTWGFEFAEAAKAKWNGEGLPPVGTLCECRVIANADWARCEIVAHKDHYAIAYVDENTVMLSQGIRFRPVLTPEQIEAKERDRDIATLVQHFCADCAFDVDDPEVTASVTKIYDAGYRKQ